MICGKTAGASLSNPVGIVQFEFESNLEALQVPNIDRCLKRIKLCYILQADGETEVLVAGEPERRHMAMCDKQGGMRYHPNAIEILVCLHLQLALLSAYCFK